MPDDVMSMRQDAVRRAREMYSRSRPAEPRHEPRQPEQRARNVEPENTGTNPEPAAIQAPAQGDGKPDIFETFFKDKEKMLVLALLVMLSQEENCDNSLLFALMFLLI